MDKRRVLVVFGTRPEAVKMAPVIKELTGSSEFACRVCVTAQHREMLDQVLSSFAIEPDYDLDLMRPNQSLFDVTSAALSKLGAVMQEYKPALVLVQGDTTTTFTASLAAFYLRIPVGHVEAGLRTHDKYSPYPEEVNRCLTAAIADLNFAPTKSARANLLAEGVSDDNIFVTGNTVVDALYRAMSILEIEDRRVEVDRMLGLTQEDVKMVLITGHRRESFGEGFKNICNAIRRLARAFSECDFVYPVHLNPNVLKPVRSILNHRQLRNVHLIEPVEYLSFVHLMRGAYLILTDSGGIQEEALALGKPVLVMRDTTERPEGVEVGAVKLVGSSEDRIFGECKRLLTDRLAYSSMSGKPNPYGDGRASERIVEVIRERL